jgi:hypothetical protein
MLYNGNMSVPISIGMFREFRSDIAYANKRNILYVGLKNIFPRTAE